MGSWTEIECDACGYRANVSGDGVNIATTDSGALIVCAHPAEEWFLHHATGGMGWFAAWKAGRLRTMSDWHCLACGERGLYRWTLRGAEALLSADAGPVPDTHLRGWTPDRVRRCGRYQCAACGRRRLVSGGLLRDLLTLPELVWGERQAPLPCLRCRRRGVRLSAFIS